MAESIAWWTLHEVLLKLPMRDVARCRCVCKAWRRFLIDVDPSFHRLHAHAHAGSGTEALLVSQARQAGKTMVTNVLSVSSPNPMCRIVDLTKGYRVASVCNGFILLASGKRKDPVFVCNPATGEKLRVQAPPGLKASGTGTSSHHYAMGFCASSSIHHQYKLFRLPIQEWTTDDTHIDMYTFGGGSGGGSWRRHPDQCRRYGARWVGSVSPPVLVDGKIYVLTKKNPYLNTPNSILVIDVASEAHRSYRLMPDHEDSDAAMTVLELRGQPCVVVHVPIPKYPDHSELHLWVMPTPQLVQGGQPQLEKNLPGDWTRRYSFHCHGRLIEIDYFHRHEDRPVGSWVEGDRVLCCLIGDRLYRYDTTKHTADEDDVGGRRFSSWDDQLRLPSPPKGCYERRGIYGGYRPTLLSPQDLGVQQQHDGIDNVDDEQFQQAWLDALRCHKSSYQCLHTPG